MQALARKQAHLYSVYAGLPGSKPRGAARRVVRVTAAAAAQHAPPADPAIAASVKQRAAAYLDAYALPEQRALIDKVRCGMRGRGRAAASLGAAAVITHLWGARPVQGCGHKL